MRSEASESARSASLRDRVAWVAALSTLAGGAIIAVVSALLGGVLVRDQEDRRLRGVIETLRFELQHEAPTHLAASTAVDAAVGRIADDEQAEVRETGVRVAAFRGAVRIGGASITRAAAEDCASMDPGSRRQCVETVRLAPGYEIAIVAESSLAPLARVERWWAAAAVAGLLGLALIAAYASRRVASLAIAPLERLRQAVASIEPSHPDPAAVAQPIPCREVDEIRAEFHALLDRVAVILAQSERFAANVAHEWRTPLATLRAEVDLLREDAEAASIREPLRRVDAQVRELTERLARVLVLARADAASGRLADTGEPVSLETTIREAVGALDDDRRSRVDVHAAPDEEGLVRGDAALLQMMVRNALENALVHGGAGRVSVALARTDRLFSVRVGDEGSGIPQEERERVFEPFYRGDRARRERTKGMGLGLALIRHIARLHGGDAQFEAVSRGASLIMTIPIWEQVVRAE
jgi:signal transduction histidine kinase